MPYMLRLYVILSTGSMRYTVQINGQEKYLFNEGNKWFVEAKN